MRCIPPSAAMPRAPWLCGAGDELGKQWSLLVANIGKGDIKTFNKPVFPKGEQMGVGFHEAPRGVLSHWVVIKDGKIKNYQCVVPTTWNAAPRNEKDVPGAVRGLPARQSGGRSRKARWKCCAPCIPSTPAWPAPCMSWTRRTIRWSP